MKIPDAVLRTLQTWRRQQAGELLQRTGISRQSLMRAINELGDQVVSRGHARRTAYAARRAVRGSLRPLPLYRIDSSGLAHEAGLLEPVYPEGCALQFAETFQWPLDKDMADGWFDGIPYPLADMRPQGFLGRHFAHQVAAMLQVDNDVTRWNEDDILHVLSVMGSDQPGNLILGEQALRHFLSGQLSSGGFLDQNAIATAYPRQAALALTFGIAGSSAAGEFPKFTARRLLRGQPVHVIVKFSGADGSPQEQRWADLLVCEHLAATTIADTLGLGATQGRIHQFDGRTFYEIDRFDRHGESGRSGVCSWLELNAALYGLNGSWAEGAEAMSRAGHLGTSNYR